LPFVETCRGNETTTLSKGFSKQREPIDGLGPCIDMRHLGLLLHPKRNKPPHHNLTLAITAINANDWDLVGWGNIVAGWEVRLGPSVGFEEPAVGVASNEVVVPATHFSGQMSGICSPDPPISAGKSLNFGSPSRMGRTVSA